jgi:hypothetical protein
LNIYNFIISFRKHSNYKYYFFSRYFIMPVGGITSDMLGSNIDLGRGSGMEPSTDVQFAAGMAGGRRRGRRSRRARSSRRGSMRKMGGARRRSRKSRKSRRSRR